MNQRPSELPEPAAVRAALARVLVGRLHGSQTSIAQAATQRLHEYRRADVLGTQLPTEVSQSSLSRFLAGHDLSYARVVAIWNAVAKDATPRPGDPIADWCVPAPEVVYGHPQMTLGELVSQTSSLNISFLPWKPAKAVTGVLHVSAAVEALAGEPDTVPVMRAVERCPACLSGKPPWELDGGSTIGSARVAFLEQLRLSPFHYIAFVTRRRKGKTKRLGLISQYDVL